jgi:cytochrome c6
MIRLTHLGLIVCLALLMSSQALVQIKTLPTAPLALKYSSVVSVSAIAMLLTVGTTFAIPVTAHALESATQGKVLFQASCAGCHAGGQNFVAPDKTLQMEALKKYRTMEPIKLQEFLQKEMPHRMLPLKFSDEDYKSVTGYVLDQALADKW